MPEDVNNQDVGASGWSGSGASHPTACYHCRQARQKCDRQEPCVRCTCHGLECRFPPRSNRGRKRGSTNKPDTVEKLLSRISDSSVRDGVIAAILSRHQPDASSSSVTGSESSPEEPDQHSGRVPKPRDTSSIDDRDDSSYGNEEQDSLYSPLQILAAAVAADKRQGQSSGMNSSNGDLDATSGRALYPHDSSSTKSSPVVDERLSRYFAPRVVDKSDWDVLTEQSPKNRFRMDATTCDPVSAGLINQSDVSLYFQLFFEIRNPFVSFLDPDLHTADYVRSTSFTLFSVVCALGSAVSTRPRDRLLHPILTDLAEDNIKWSISASVKSIEMIQAIVSMTYWAPTYDKLCDDPYWLRVSHATQLARELGLHHPDTIAQKLKAVYASSAVEKERLLRNYQRVWLHIFVVDKSFGMTTGRTVSVSWREIPMDVTDWWRRPSATLLDRVICGCVENRVAWMKGQEELRRLSKTRQSLISWRARTFERLVNLQNSRCTPDELPSSFYLPILKFYMDHLLLVLNAYASRHLIAIDGHEASSELADISQQTLQVSIRFMDHVLSDQTMVKLMLGFHNTAHIMMAHGATEVIHAIKRNPSSEEAVNAGHKLRMIANHIENIASLLPSTSWASLYARLIRLFVGQLEEVTSAAENNVALEDQNALFNDWWKFVDVNSFDFASGIPMGLIGSVPQMMDSDWDFNI